MEPIFTELGGIVKKTPLSERQWNALVRRLVLQYDPLRIYLYGSYVWGTPDGNSDLDLCVLLPRPHEFEGHHTFLDNETYDLDVEIDVDVYLPSRRYFEKMLSSPATLEYLMYRKGIVLYTKPDLVLDRGKPMYRLDEEFIEKAKENLRMSRKAIDDEKPMIASCLFHIHQTYEMSLRAFRAFHLQEILKTHKIGWLRLLCIKIDSDFATVGNFSRRDARRITEYYTARYRPHESFPSPEIIEEQIEFAEKLLRFVEQKMSSTPRPTEPTPLNDSESEISGEDA